MRDLIRNYKMVLTRSAPQDSSSESQPLLTSERSATSSFGSIKDSSVSCDSDTDYEPDQNGASVLNSLEAFKRPMLRAFCFPGRNDAPSLDVYTNEAAVYERFSNFSKATGTLEINLSTLILDKDFGSFEHLELPPTQNSLVTIFAIWNTIMGTSLLAIPWGIEQAGLFPAIFINVLIAGICLYTCHVLLQVNNEHGFVGQDNEFGLLCRALLGKWAELLARVFSIIVLIGSNIVYWVLMSNFLYNSVYFIYDYLSFPNEALKLNSTVICPREANLNLTMMDLRAPMPVQFKRDNFEHYWNLYGTAPVVLAVLMFPILNFKSATFFTKFNSLGTLSVLYLFIFVSIKAYSWGINISDWEMEMAIKPTFCALSGMLSLSYFIHNIVISVMRNNRNQRNNGRDLSIAFCLVTFTYMFIGVLFYVSFPLDKNCIEDNILNNFSNTDMMTIVARLLLLFQLFTVFPLITYMLRMEIFTNVALLLRECVENFSYWRVILVNIVVVTVCILFACFLPKIGTLIRYTGALSGLVYIFLLPSLLKLALLHRKQSLTCCKCILFSLIVLFGFVNLLSQFFIMDK